MRAAVRLPLQHHFQDCFQLLPALPATLVLSFCPVTSLLAWTA